MLKKTRDAIKRQQEWLRCLSLTFLISAAVYLVTRIFAFTSFLKKEEAVEADQHFAYAYEIHILNICHSLTFCVLGIFVQRMSAQTYLIFKKEHYGCILNFIVTTAFLYVVPLFGIIILSYVHGEEYSKDATEHRATGLALLFRWTIETMFSDKAGVPLFYTILLHMQLMGLLCGLLFISQDLYTNMERLSTIRAATKQDRHDALELNSIHGVQMQFSEEPTSYISSI